MRSRHDLDRLLVSLDVAVQSFAVCEVAQDRRLVSSPVDAIMVHYVLHGTMYVEVPGHEPLVCEAGSLALIPAGMQPSMTAQPGPAREVMATEHCSVTREGMLVFDAADGRPGDLRYVAGILLASISGSFGLLDRLNVPIATNLADICIVQQAYESMLKEIAQPSLGTRALTSALMKACLVMAIRRLIEHPGTQEALIGALADPRLSRAVMAILKTPAAPHTLQSLAGEAGMSRSAFTRRFVDSFQLAPMEFVAKTRLFHGANMLRTTPLPVNVIGKSIGFASRSHFSKAFRAAYGIDPSGFRRTHADGAALDASADLYGSREQFGLAGEPAG